MKAAILASSESWYTRDLERARPAGCQLQTVSFQQLSASVGPHGTTVGDGQTNLLQYDAVIVRTMPPGSLEQVVARMDVLHLCQAHGVQVVNAPRAVEVAVDKYLATARLQLAGLRVPETWVGESVEGAWQAFRRLGGDVVCKPLFGSEGRGIFRLSDPDLAGRAFASLARCQSVIYLQRYVPHEGYDWRVLVLGEQLWGMQRTNAEDWRCNVHRGASVQRMQVQDPLSQLARQAAAAVGARWAGVDILPGADGEIYVIEVNAVPGWRALAEVNQVDIAQHLWADLYRLVDGSA